MVDRIWLATWTEGRGHAGVELADAVHRLWRERVTNDLWRLWLPYDTAGTSCDQLFASATDLLTWWTAHRDAVTAAFT
ncbi:hypothetical protein [Micromonospora sp. LOL_024]|uniref:hypothetical protein n=1 Tax=Micromonospora sp. LOL_024 TaxID=3345412 RepID=UPI003A878646